MEEVSKKTLPRPEKIIMQHLVADCLEVEPMRRDEDCFKVGSGPQAVLGEHGVGQYDYRNFADFREHTLGNFSVHAVGEAAQGVLQYHEAQVPFPLTRLAGKVIYRRTPQRNGRGRHIFYCIFRAEHCAPASAAARKCCE